MIRKLDMTASWKKIGNIVFFANKILLSIRWLDYNWAQLTGVTQLLLLGLDMDQIKFDEYFWPTFKPGTEQSFHPAKSLICPISNHSIGFFFSKNPWELSDIMTVCMLTDDITCWKSIPFFLDIATLTTQESKKSRDRCHNF